MASASLFSPATATVKPPSLFSVHRRPGFRRRNPFPPLRVHHTIACSALAQPEDSDLLQAAKHVVDTYTKSGMVIGLGSGHASSLAIKYLGRQLRTGSIKDVIGIPTSVSSASEAARAGVPLEEYNEHLKIDLVFDDADTMEEETLCAVIGRQGQESMIQEKAVVNAAEKLVLIVKEKQYRESVDGSIPVLINSLNWLETAEEIDDLFLGDAEVWRRSAVGHSDPLGGNFPLVTKEGHNVLDVIFTSPILKLAEVADSLDQISGVVEHGIVTRTRCTAIIVTYNGLRVLDNTVDVKSSKL